uniref:Uncharacterized protein n=1 Tax=Knipowitschia caucasica TaxID=637954 RepID=A0AAV2JHR2_KNICA
MPSQNVLFCLSANNFSCSSFQAIIRTLDGQKTSMGQQSAEAVFTHLINPFLLRNNPSDPGCRSSSPDTKRWLEDNLGRFSEFATTLAELKQLNPNISTKTLTGLTPAQIAQLTLSEGFFNDTNAIASVFQQLEEGNSFENVNQFYQELQAGEGSPAFEPEARDVAMNRTFAIISIAFNDFTTSQWKHWFLYQLEPVLSSFKPQMFTAAQDHLNCTNYRIVVKGLSKASRDMPEQAQRGLARGMFKYIKNVTNMVTQPECKRVNETDGEWLQENLGSFTEHLTYSDIRSFNLSQVHIADSLSPNQQADLLLELESGNLEEEAVVSKVLENYTRSPEELGHFFRIFSNITKQRNITYIQNENVRDTILNQTWTVLVEYLVEFDTQDYEEWFGSNLLTLILSFKVEYVQAIPDNISCDSYEAIDSAFEKSYTSAPLTDSASVESTIKSLRTRFPRCSIPASFECKVLLRDETLICAEVDSSQVEQTHSTDASAEATCGYTVIEHACSSATNITARNVAMLLNCSRNGTKENPAVWKLLFSKASPVLDAALEMFSTMVGNTSFPSLSSALEAIVELRISDFDPAQLQNQSFIGKWFQTKIRPFLAMPSQNVLFCLSANNFSCSSFQAIIRTLDGQKTSMGQQSAEAVFTHLINPFLLRNNPSDPGCRSSSPDTKRWLEDNLGRFSEFATLAELKQLNPNISTETLTGLTPAQIAQLTLSEGFFNDTNAIASVFQQLEEGNSFENVNQFYQELQAGEGSPAFEPEARDVAMNRTFAIISIAFNDFTTSQWKHWFLYQLEPVLSSFKPQMFTAAQDHLNCTNYRIVVKGLSKASRDMPEQAQRGLARGMFKYIKNVTNMVTQPACNQGIKTDSERLKLNLGTFIEHLTYTEIQSLNLTDVRIGDLSAEQQADFLLEPTNLSNETYVTDIFKTLTQSPDTQKISSFYNKFVTGASQQNLSLIEPGIRDSMFNSTINFLGPQLPLLQSEDVRLWFQVYLTLFLPSINANTFEVIPRDISCDSYQHIVKGCDKVFVQLSESQTQYVYTFTRDYLSRPSSGSSCVDSVNDDRDWIGKNLGQFRTHASYREMLTFKEDLKGVEVLDLLTFSQIAELAATPSQLQTREDVTKVMTGISPEDLGIFFDTVSPAIQMHQGNYTEEVTSSLLQTALDKANLSSPSVSDPDYLLWLNDRLNPLLVNLSSTLVTPLFDTVQSRSCNISQYMYSLLDSISLTLSQITQQKIYENIYLHLQEPTPIRCYERGSFYGFLKNTFLSFGFPDVPMFMSLLPTERKAELLATVTTSEVGQFFSQPNVIGDFDICDFYNNYNQTPAFLEREDVPDDVRLKTLPCVWPMALSSESQSEAALWFDLRLKNYLRFLNKNLISSSQVKNATCFSFQKLVAVMGNNFTYNSTEFVREDFYNSMKTYLVPESGIKCYNASTPGLNSNSWFVENIGAFVMLVTVEDLNAFIPSGEGGSIYKDRANVELFNNPAISEDVRNVFVGILFERNPTSSPITLPDVLLCSPDIPTPAFESLNETETLRILQRLKEFCNGTEDPEVNTALVSNLKSFSAETFSSLGSASGGLTTTQISSVPGHVLISSLGTLGSVSSWNQEQAGAVIKAMFASGFQIKTGSSLSSLGTLIVGISSGAILNIPSSELLSISGNPAFINNMLIASPVVKEVFVRKIISVDSSPANVVENVPNELATKIPLSMLLFTSGTVDINQINKKTWTSEQAPMFFESVSTSDFDEEELSPSVLQGFTCTTVRKASKNKIKKLVRACRQREGRSKVFLKESQLTCMYNFIKEDITQTFTEYPSDLLLYLDAKDVQGNSCRSYISVVGAADFSVASPVLNKPEKILNEAISCLEIRNTSLRKEDIQTMGNLLCTMNSSYIQNSDPYVLEALKSCKDLSESQVAAVEAQLQSGKTSYGLVSTWDEETLQNLEPLPLYFTKNIWSQVKTTKTRTFLKRFMRKLRKSKTEKRKLKSFFKSVNGHRAKRGAGCTVGNITAVTVQDNSFPFGYDQSQFDLCLDLSVLKESLSTICEKVDDDGFQAVILKKLNEAYPAGVSDENVQVLGSASRTASLLDISKWNITKVDTLSALMNTDNGPWEAEKSKAVITKYLSTPGNALNTTELNAIDSNLCSLDTATLTSITSDNLRNAKSLNVASCSLEQKKVIYETSKTAFSSNRGDATVYFNLIKNYLGGAPLADIQTLSGQNIHMDISTFQSLDTNVINNLTVGEVQGLLGSSVADLKTFEKAPVVEAWINTQTQPDLDTLDLGLTTTRVTPTAPPLTINNSTAANTSAPGKYLHKSLQLTHSQQSLQK